jgi:hypothetical protein
LGRVQARGVGVGAAGIVACICIINVAGACGDGLGLGVAAVLALVRGDQERLPGSWLYGVLVCFRHVLGWALVDMGSKRRGHHGRVPDMVLYCYTIMY